MGKTEIKDKLYKFFLSKRIDEIGEPHVIYALSRIRKLIEPEKKEYQLLWFYCSWALHYRMDGTDPVKDMVKEFVGEKDEGFIDFSNLIRALTEFIDGQGLPSELLKNEDNKDRLRELFRDIYSDTPLRFKDQTGFELTLTAPKITHPDTLYGAGYKVVALD